jgi:hypothetical protein
MIMMMAKYGDHYIGGRARSPFKSDADVKRFFAAWGTNFRDVSDRTDTEMIDMARAYMGWERKPANA